ncbi:hypothetical protein QBC36DRAFT_336800 [Triangularia setosa]|uniref:2EXR domain-containing protein n=1 Tax=Triangularia setosa TaxID=2587417 RepID=A0AAN6W294_9PEZI|nr:hypothetical protein QBC36DRAFT_336800 [Podospora setosa]
MPPSDTPSPQFQQLPAEIRCHIWRFCFRQRTASVGWITPQAPTPTTLKLWPLKESSQPIAMVCYEAKNETILYRKSIEDLGLASIARPSRWLNTSTDTLYIQPPDPYPERSLSTDSALMLQRLIFSGIAISFHHRLLTDWGMWEKCSPNSTLYEIWKQLEELAKTSSFQPQRWRVVVMESDFLLTRDEALSSGLWGPFAEPGDVAYHHVDKIRDNQQHAVWRALSLHLANQMRLNFQSGAMCGRMYDWHLQSPELVKEREEEYRVRLSAAETSSQWLDCEGRRAHVERSCLGTRVSVSSWQKGKWIGLCDNLSRETLLISVVKLQWHLYEPQA